MRSVLSHVRLVPPLIVFVQFLDYTKEPLEKALSKNPPSPKFDAIFDAVGLLSSHTRQHILHQQESMSAPDRHPTNQT
jgi:hypothetical protein